MVVTGLGFYATDWNKHFLLFSVIEVGLIYLFGLLFIGRSRVIKVIGYILTSFLAFLYLVNIGSVLFAGTYVTFQMWNNLANVKALGSSLPLYISAIMAALIVAFLPVKSLKLARRWRFADFGVIVLTYILIWLVPFQTPLIGWAYFLGEYQQVAKSAKILAENNARVRKTAYKEFARKNITGGIDIGLKDPNIIVIFTEGFSSEIMNINNGNMYPGLTPNLDKFSGQTVNFANYFNHTAATYRGIRGQLSSSQQYLEGYENGDDAIESTITTKMDSVQSILGEKGYTTEFINAEPQQSTWTTYVNNLGFQNVVSLPDSQLEKDYGDPIISDQRNYKLLFETAKRLNGSGSPFFLADYTFQTHVGLDSKLKYGDGSNSYLNKYHNLDDAFGKFWNDFQKSDLAKNTVVIFSADHAAFPDPTYKKTFNTARGYFISPIPLMIWYPGLTDPSTIDVGGRNSLALAPTILDLTGAEDSKNYFLGNTLFSSNISPLEYVFASGDTKVSTRELTQSMTKDNTYHVLSSESVFAQQIQRYYSISLNY